MITWTAEVVPYAAFFMVAIFAPAMGFFIFLALKKIKSCLLSLALFVGAGVLIFVNPGTYQVSGELEIVDARVVSVKDNGVYSFSNGVELSGDYELGETIQLLCVPSTVECVPDDGELRNASELESAIYSRVAEEQDVSWATLVQGLSLERHAEAD